MAGGKDVTVRAQALDGTWQTIGGDRARGLYPENVVLEADSWGSSRAAFNLRRDPTAFWPELGAFTPVEFEVGSSLVWSGRIKETPSQVAQRVMNVQCEGWQYHLDDDVYNRMYVHTNLADWKDARGFVTVDLSKATQSGQVSTEGGIVLGFQSGATIPASSYVGVILDLGSSNKAARVAMDWQSAQNISRLTVWCKGVDDVANLLTGAENLFSFGAASATFGTTSNTFAGTYRYVAVILQENTGAAYTLPADTWLRITNLRVFADVAYAAGATSDLRASSVAIDGVTRATTLLSSDLSGIQTTSFVIPSFTPGWQTPRQTWTGVDSYQDWLKQIDVNRRPIYQAKPSRPIFEVGPWSALDDDDASANSGEEIYNRTLITAQSPDGQPVVVDQPQALSAQAQFFSGVGGIGGPGGSFALGFNTTSTATFKKGVTYAIRVQSITVSSFVAAGSLTAGRVGSGTGGPPWSGGDIVAYPDIALPAAGTYGPFAWVLWTPTADRTNPVGYSASWSGDMHIDVTFQAVWGATFPERRGFRRTMQLPVSSSLPSDGLAAAQIGNVWLADHKKTPFRGTVTLTGDEALRHVTSGRNVGLEELLLNTGQIVRFSDRSDPDTGGHGRDGRIAAVSYTPASNSASVTIDNSRTSFDALLSRLAIIQGG